MLSIVKHKKPKNLPVCEMNCDGHLHEKLEKYELTKFINTHSTNLIVGKPGSGKTSILYTLFKSKKLLGRVFHNIYLFRPTESGGSIKDDIFDTLPDEQKYNELTYDDLEDCINRIKASNKKEVNCIIFDDMGAYLKNKAVEQLFKELVYNRRHLHTTIFFLCQTFKSISKDIRKLFTNLFIFKVGLAELEDIFKEVIPSKNRNELMNELIETVFDVKYNFLFYNTDTNRFFRNWDEIKINM